VVLLTTFSKYGLKLHLSCVAARFSDMREPDSYKFPTFTEPKVSLVCSEESISGPYSEWNACSPCPHTACVWEPLQYYCKLTVPWLRKVQNFMPGSSYCVEKNACVWQVRV